MDTVNILTLVALPLATFFCVFVFMWWCMFWHDGDNQKQEKKNSKFEGDRRESDIARTVSKEDSDNTSPAVKTQTCNFEQTQHTDTQNREFLQRFTKFRTASNDQKAANSGSEQKTSKISFSNGLWPKFSDARNSDSAARGKTKESGNHMEVPAVILSLHEDTMAVNNVLGGLELVDDSNSLDSLDIYTRCGSDDN
mmetsp:Transcript_10332/g.15878  ORF Transcript_10332/g.15878 Transcript_10332/m.15878 type:complete len:196 (+) Transcript_10332:61-648(+)